MAVSIRRSGCFLAIALTFTTIGCDSSSNSGGGVSLDEMAGAMDAEKAAKAQQEQAKQEAERAAQEAQAAAAAQKAAEPAPLETVTAHSPKKGKSLEGGGYLSVVAGTRFWAEHQLILDNVKYAIKLYWGEKGYYPKTHEVFMNDIIKANDIKLPELPEGYEYVYDPTDPLELKMRNTGSGEPNAIQ